jgi:hypothetical protein
MRMRRRDHYSGDYATRRHYLIAAANADPRTICWRCRRTLAEHEPHRNGRKAYWTAGHVRDGDPTSPLLPEASTCNYSAGGRLGNARRSGRRFNGNPTSRRWFT